VSDEGKLKALEMVLAQEMDFRERLKADKIRPGVTLHEDTLEALRILFPQGLDVEFEPKVAE
jgi:hypothetical protein